MKKATTIWLIIAAVLLLVGCALFAGVMNSLDWDFTKLSTDQYETKEYLIKDTYKNISIVTDTAEVVFVPAENEQSIVTCLEPENMTHTVTVRNDTLVIEITDDRSWYEHIGIHFQTPKITVSIPRGQYGALSIKGDTGDVEVPNAFGFESTDISLSTGRVKNYASTTGNTKIKTSTGDIFVENIFTDALDLSVSTGRITVSNATCAGDARIEVSTGKASITGMTCKNLLSEGDTGHLALTKVITAETLSVERDTGDVKLDRCDAAEIIIETDTGDVTGTLLSEKIFIVETDTGHVDVPKTTTGGRCEISTDTGDIRITIAQ